MKKGGKLVFTIIFGITSLVFIFIGISTIVKVNKAIKNGYEKTKFTVVDYEITDVDKRRKKTGKRRKTYYRIEYNVTYEYEYDDVSYTYYTSSHKDCNSSTEQPCRIGSVTYYYIDPENPDDTSRFIASNNKTGGVVTLVMGVIFFLIAGVFAIVSMKKGPKNDYYGSVYQQQVYAKNMYNNQYGQYNDPYNYNNNNNGQM